MNYRKHFLPLVPLLLPLSLPAKTPAQGDADPPRVPTAELSGKRSDPFQISYLMRQRAINKGQGAQFVPLRNAQVPRMKLKGLVNERLALLEVETGGVYLVRAGETISLHQGGRNLVIRIEQIDALSLMVKVGTLEESIVVR